MKRTFLNAIAFSTILVGGAYLATDASATEADNLSGTAEYDACMNQCRNFGEGFSYCNSKCEKWLESNSDGEGEIDWTPSVE